MSSGMPELGSKISLISKADIRYEGELYTVDPVECTIALSNVRSFGTEEREAKCPVPAQAQIYDFILFRGSDIKDIRVVQGQPMPPNDPAIVQHQISHPPPSAAPGYPGVVQPSHSHAFSHHMGAAPGSHLMGSSLGGQHHVHPSVSAGGYNPMSGMTFTREPHKPMPQAGVPGLVHEPQPTPQPRVSQNSLPQNQTHPTGSSSALTQMGLTSFQKDVLLEGRQPHLVKDLIGSLSRSSTPAPRKSPSLDHVGNTGGGSQRLGMGQRAVQRPQSRQSRSRERLYNNHHSNNNSQGGDAAAPSQAPPALTYRDRNDFYDRSEMRHEYTNHRGGDNSYNNRNNDNNYRGGDNRRDNNRDRDRVYNNYRSGGGGGGRGGGGGGWGGQNAQSQPPVRSGSGGRRPRPRSRGPGFGAGGGGGGGGGGYHSGGGGKGGPRGSGGTPGNTLKFESDYDFDKANTEFNEMLSKLNETKLEDGGAPVVVNGSAPASEGDKKEDGGEPEHEGETDEDKFYDKTKSFFDNISCEAVERSRGAFQRTDWRQERKMNSETFGVAATRRGGGYRGRGGFYYGGGGRGYHHRTHYNSNPGRNNRGGGYGPRLGGGNPRHGGGYGSKDTSSTSSVVKTAAQVVASGTAAAPPPAVAAEAK